MASVVDIVHVDVRRDPDVVVAKRSRLSDVAKPGTLERT